MHPQRDRQGYYLRRPRTREHEHDHAIRVGGCFIAAKAVPRGPPCLSSQPTPIRTGTSSRATYATSALRHAVGGDYQHLARDVCGSSRAASPTVNVIGGVAMEKIVSRRSHGFARTNHMRISMLGQMYLWLATMGYEPCTPPLTSCPRSLTSHPRLSPRARWRASSGWRTSTRSRGSAWICAFCGARHKNREF